MDFYSTADIPYPARKLIEAQRILIEKLEKENESRASSYEKIISSQTSVINKLEKRHNEVLNTLLESFDEMEGKTYANKVEEIQSDINNLMQMINEIKEHELSSPEKQLRSNTLDLSPMNFNSMTRNFKSFLCENASSINNDLNSSFEIDNSFNIFYQDANITYRSEFEPSTSFNEFERSFLNENNNMYIPSRFSSNDIQNDLQNHIEKNKLDQSLPIQRQQAALILNELSPAFKYPNHLQKLFKKKESTKAKNEMIDFECQFNSNEDDHNKNLDHVKQELIQSNKNLLYKLDAKNNEIKNLNSLIRLLEENGQIDEIKINEMKQIQLNLEKMLEDSQNQSEKENLESLVKSRVEMKYEQKLENLKSAFNKMLNLYNDLKNTYYINYNKLHNEYLKLKSNYLIVDDNLSINSTHSFDELTSNLVEQSLKNKIEKLNIRLKSEIALNEVLKRKLDLIKTKLENVIEKQQLSFSNILLHL